SETRDPETRSVALGPRNGVPATHGPSQTRVNALLLSRGAPRGDERKRGRHGRRAPGTMDLRARGCYHGHRPMHGITALQRMPKNVAAALAITATLAAGVAGGLPRATSICRCRGCWARSLPP